MRYFIVCWGVFLWTVSSSLMAATNEPANVICLTFDHPDRTPEPDGSVVSANLVYHELVRQTVLNCARDQFGLVTRDASLGEPFPKDESDSLVLRLSTRNVSGKRVEIELKQADNSLIKGVLEYAYDADAAGESDFADAVYKWGMNELPQIFEQLGYQPLESQDVNLTETPIPQNVKQQLQQLNPFSQYLAVRMTYQDIADQGPSIGRLAALARAYGNLSQLTEFYPLQMRVVFFARGTLCGTRMMHLAPESPIGYWHRGYVNMLGGLSQTGWWDFEKTESLVGNQPEPEWMPLMKMAYEYDFNTLKKESRTVNDQRELATLLWYRSVEFGGSDWMNLTTGKKCLGIMPLSTRINNGMDEAAGVSYGHATSQLGIQQFRQLLLEKLPDILAEDDQLREALADQDLTDGSYAGLAKIRDALLDAIDDDTIELSAATLARLIDEEVVTTIIDRAYFLRFNLGANPTGFLVETRPFYKNHPHASLIESSGLPYHYNPERFLEVLQDFQFPVGNVRTIRGQFVNRIVWLDPKLVVNETSFKDYSTQLFTQRTIAESDLICTYSSATVPENLLTYAGWMGGMNPNSPWRHKIFALHAWEKYKDDQEWLEKQGNHPVVAAAIAESYENSGEYIEAVKWYEKSIAGAPDFKTYRSLSELYWNKVDDQQKAIKIAEDFLSEVDFGLSHSTLSIDVTYHLLDRDLTAQAMEWGLRAASSGSARGYMALADCHVRDGEFEKAYQLYQQSDQHYEAANTYFFVVRTGYGDIKQARQDLLKNRPPTTSVQKSFIMAHDAVIDGDTEQAFKQFTEIHQSRDDLDPLVVFKLAELADKLNKSDRRDELWSLFLELPEDDLPEDSDRYRYRELAKLLLSMTAESIPDFETVNQIHPLTGNTVNHNSHYYVGAQLKSMGNKEQAIKHFRHVLKYAIRDSTMFLFACLHLRDLGEDPNQLPQRWIYKTYETDTEEPVTKTDAN